MDQTTALVVVGVIVLAAIVAVGLFLAMKRRRSTELRQRFGPEYDRALEGHRDRRSAEQDLSDRERRARGLQLRPLSEDERQGFSRAWASVQRRFVDDPSGAVSEAQALLEAVMRQRGYPTSSFEEEVALLSVHHPGTVQHYRAAQALAEEPQDGDAATEQIRQAVIHYRVLFEELLEIKETDDDTRETRPFAVTPAESQSQQRI
jgi:FtsZ-interacting cell division protein ZipA